MHESPSSGIAAGQSQPFMTRRRTWMLFAVLGAAWIPALTGRAAVPAAADLYPLAAGSSPYFVPQHAILLYLWAPLVVAGVSVLFLAPGLLLALALNRARGLGTWMSVGFATSVVLVSAAAASAQEILGQPLTGNTFLAVVAGCWVAAAGVLLFRLLRGHVLPWPLGERPAVELTPLIVPPLLVLIALSPKFYWEAFDGDGAHAIETARLLLFQPLPFWSRAVGGISSYPGFTTMLFAYPASWFLRVFGDVEVSARLPLIPSLAALYAALVALIEHGTQALGAAARWLLWAGLGAFVVVMAFSATYDPYHADIASPFTQDVQHIAFFLGFLLALLRGDRPLMALFLPLTFLSSGGSALLIVLGIVSVGLASRPCPWKRLGWGLGMMAGVMLVVAVTPKLLAAAGISVPGGEHGIANLVRKFRFLQVDDWRRILFLLVPSGVLPAIVMVAGWRRHDAVARAITIMTLAWFGIFYIQAYTSLHYYVPCMVLPLIAFWRSDFARGRLMPAGVAAGSLTALLLAWPAHAAPVMASREFGASVDARVGGYETMKPAAIRCSEMLRNLLPFDSDARVPGQSYGGSPLAWNYYARRPKPPGTEINYVIQRATDATPAGARLVAEGGGFSLYMRSEERWARHRALRPPSPAGSPSFAIQPRNLLFRGARVEGGPRIFDLKRALGELGLIARSEKRQ